MFSGNMGQHLPKGSCVLVKVGLPLQSLSTMGGNARNKLQDV